MIPGIRWKPPHLLVLGVSLAYLAPHLLILAEPRFHLTILPSLTVYAAYGWVERKKVLESFSFHGGRWKLALAVVLAAGLLFNWAFDLWSDAEKLRLLFGPEGNQLYFDY